MREFARRAVAGVCSVALVASMVPLPAFASAELQSASVDEAKLAKHAAAIDSQAGAYEDGEMIVVYREGAAPSKKTACGIQTQSVSIEGMPSAHAEVLSEDAGTPGGGAALRVDVPSGMSVGQAVAAARQDANVVLAQPNYTYYLMDERAPSAPVTEQPPSAPDAAQPPSASDASYAAQLPSAPESPRDTLSASIDAISGATATPDEPADSAEAQAASSSADGFPLPDDPYVGIAENDTAQYPSKPNQWWIHAVGAPRAWSMVHGSDNPVTVAVLDTGISFEHEDLRSNILADYAYDTYNDAKLTDSIDNDEMQHGTHVAGIIAAEANNAKGIAGVSYNAKIIPIRVFHLAYSAYYGAERASCTDEDLIRAYDYLLSDADGNGKTVAEETNTHVVNMSLGGYLKDDLQDGESEEDAYDYLFEDKIEQAEEAGILTVAAAGNGDSFGNGRTDASYPSDYAAVMSVVALKNDEQRVEWSDHNAMKNIAAPGVNIYSTYWTSDSSYQFESGTSMATPIVAGCAALLWAYDPGLSVRDVKDALYGTADDLGVDGFDEYYGWGRVNAGAAVASLGTAAISMDAGTMTRTASQQLSASERANTQARHTWKWAVDDPSVARISDTGELTALAPGKVVVTATAADDGSLSGRRTITVEDIAIPEAVVASANPTRNTIAISWKSAEAAVRYKMLRATAAAGTTTQPGEFAELGVYDAATLATDGNVTFIDETAKPGELYWYRVVPVGMLDGAPVAGLPSTSNRCFYTDKAVLKQAIDRAEGLLDATVTSMDGAEIPADRYWAPASARTALSVALNDAYGAYMSGTMLQVKVDACERALSEAADTFAAVRKPGLQKVQNTLAASAVAGVHETTYGSQLVVQPGKLYQIEGAQGTLTFKVAAAPAGVTVAPDGTLIIAKGVAAGTHVVAIEITAAGTDVALPKTQTVTATVKVEKAQNRITAAGKRPALTYKASKAQSLPARAAVQVGGAQGGVAYAKKSGDARITVAKSGALTVAKGTPAGTYRVGIAVHAAGNANVAPKTASATVTLSIGKAANTLKAKAKAPKVSYSASKARTIAAKKAFSLAGAAGKVAFKKVSGDKAISVKAKSGTVKVAKKARKGVHTAKIRITAAGDANHAAASKTVTLKVKVR